MSKRYASSARTWLRFPPPRNGAQAAEVFGKHVAVDAVHRVNCVTEIEANVLHRAEAKEAPCCEQVS